MIHSFNQLGHYYPRPAKQRYNNKRLGNYQPGVFNIAYYAHAENNPWHLHSMAEVISISVFCSRMIRQKFESGGEVELEGISLFHLAVQQTDRDARLPVSRYRLCWRQFAADRSNDNHRK